MPVAFRADGTNYMFDSGLIILMVCLSLSTVNST